MQTPLTILRVQANLLGKVTRGILEGVEETELSTEKVQHRLVVIAPAYNGYRLTLVAALHNPDLPYPAEVRAKSLEELDQFHRPVYPEANDDIQMAELVQSALNSQPTRAAILSLIAKSNEVRLPPPSVLQAGEGADN